jgi:plasmid stabilization system protein ParE
MKVIIREAAYDDLDRIYAWIAKTGRARRIP